MNHYDNSAGIFTRTGEKYVFIILFDIVADATFVLQQ